MSGWQGMPAGAGGGTVVFEEYDHGTGSKWIAASPCVNAVMFGGRFFCRRFMENGLGAKPD